MIRRGFALAIASAVVGVTVTMAQAPVASGFTYQGRLRTGDMDATGTHDLRFRIYDADVGGTQVGTTICLDNVDVRGGLFTAWLDFGVAPFGGEARWLEIEVRADATPANCGVGAYATLSPRQPLAATPYALGLRLPFSAQASVQSDAPIRAINTFPGPLFTAYGLWGEATHGLGRGVYGLGSATSGANVGVFGETASDQGTGVFGLASATTLGATPSFGVAGRSSSPLGRGVYGHANSSTGANSGVYGQSNSTSGRGVFGYAIALSGTTFGVYGQADSPTGYAGYFVGERNYFSGNVGIGLVAPSTKLHVVGGTDASAAGGGYITIGSESGANVAIDNNEIMARNNGNAAPLFLNNDGGNVIFVANGSGNVGIGTSAPGYPLHASSSASASVFVENSTGNGLFASVSGAGSRAVYATATGSGIALYASNGNTAGYSGYFVGGRVYFGSNIGVGVQNPQHPLHMAAGAYCDSANWVNASSRELKENFESVDSCEILERVASLPIQKWNYKRQTRETVHLGPMAEDFAAAFGLGEDDRSISTVDAAGVALAAIQGLHERLRQKECDIEALRTELASLRATIAAERGIERR